MKNIWINFSAVMAVENNIIHKITAVYKIQLFSAATLVTLGNFPKDAESMAKKNHISFYLKEGFSCEKHLSLKTEKKYIH